MKTNALLLSERRKKKVTKLCGGKPQQWKQRRHQANAQEADGRTVPAKEKKKCTNDNPARALTHIHYVPSWNLYNNQQCVDRFLNNFYLFIVVGGNCFSINYSRRRNSVSKALRSGYQINIPAGRSASANQMGRVSAHSLWH